MKPAIPILLRFLQAPLLFLVYSFTERALEPGGVLDEPLEWNFIEVRNEGKCFHYFELGSSSDLYFYESQDFTLKSRWLSHTFYAAETFNPLENIDRNAFLASTSDVLAVLTINFLSNIRSALTKGSRRSCTGFLN